MPLVHMKDMLQHAYDNAYAVGSFNIIDLHFLQGVIAAAESARAPVILGLSEPHFSHYAPALLMAAMERAARQADVPVALHFDHGSGPETVRQAIAWGCNGVMIDASHSPLEENLKRSKQVVELAHGCGVPVEAELGYVPENGQQGDALSFTTVDQARGFVRHTGVDFLAVSIGTVHGMLKGKPKLDYQRLRHINEALAIPLVIHGGSGLSEDQYHRLIGAGVAKINYHSALSASAAKAVAAQRKAGDDYSALTQGVSAAIRQEAEQCMRRWGSAGRAAEVLVRCRPWQTVEKLLLFTPEHGDIADVRLLQQRGQRLLYEIPGVREVSAAQISNDSATHPFLWRVLLAHHDALEPFRRHPNYRDFSQRLLAGLAPERSLLVCEWGGEGEGGRGK